MLKNMKKTIDRISDIVNQRSYEQNVAVTLGCLFIGLAVGRLAGYPFLVAILLPVFYWLARFTIWAK